MKMFLFFMHFCPGTMTTQSESINAYLRGGLYHGHLDILYVRDWTDVYDTQH